MAEWVVILALFAAFGAGVYVGWRWYRWSMLKALRTVGQLAEPPAIDHDAMLRIIKDHEGRR